MAKRSTRHSSSTSSASSSATGERLQKVLAAAGIGSRRECETLITEGRVEVDRVVVSELGARVDPTAHEIRVDGTVLPRPRRQYYALNKPPGVVCTNRDPSGRVRVIDLVPDKERLFAVGRLDRASEGLILVTNDGGLADRLTHPRYGIEKTYEVRVAGHPDPSELAKLRQGVYLSDGVARVTAIRVRRRQKQSTDLEIVLSEGRNREIRRILARIGHKVLSLRRIAIGSLRLKDLPVGAYRRLTREEVRELEQTVSPGKHSARRKTAAKKPRGKAKPPRKGSHSQGSLETRKSTTRAKPSAKRGTILAYDETAEPTHESPKRRKPRKSTTSAAKRDGGARTTRKPKSSASQKPSARRRKGR